MDSDTTIKLKPILLRIKLGQFVSEDDRDFARRCWREWPKEYSALQTEVIHPEAAKRIPITRPDEYLNSAQPRTPHSSRTLRTPPPRGRRT